MARYAFGRDVGAYFRAFSWHGVTPPSGKFRNYWQATQRFINTSPRRAIIDASNNALRNNHPPIQNTNGVPYDPPV